MSGASIRLKNGYPRYRTLLVLTVTVIFFAIFYFYSNIGNQIGRYNIYPKQSPKQTTPTICASTTEMLDGQWVLNADLTEEEKKSILSVMDGVRSAKGWPLNLTRSDLRCGPKYSLIPDRFGVREDIASQCDPSSLTPCCLVSEGICGSGSAFCNASSSLDYRLRRLPELSRWVPRSGCMAHNFSREEACAVISRFDHVVLFGDSLVRHLFTALMLKLTGDVVRGGLKVSTSADEMARCGYMHQFAESSCRQYLTVSWDEYRKNPLSCPGQKATLHFLESYVTGRVGELLSYIDSLPANSTRIVVGGIGVHDGFSVVSITGSMDKVLTRLDGRLGRLVWLTSHSTDTLKPIPYESFQGNHRIRPFNQQILPYFLQKNISVLDTFGMSLSAISIDGQHYGLALNLLKADAFLLQLSQM